MVGTTSPKNWETQACLWQVPKVLLFFCHHSTKNQRVYQMTTACQLFWGDIQVARQHVLRPTKRKWLEQEQALWWTVSDRNVVQYNIGSSAAWCSKAWKPLWFSYEASWKNRQKMKCKRCENSWIRVYGRQMQTDNTAKKTHAYRRINSLRSLDYFRLCWLAYRKNCREKVF